MVDEDDSWNDDYVLKFDANYNLVGLNNLKFTEKIHFLTATATELMIDLIGDLPSVKKSA